MAETQDVTLPVLAAISKRPGAMFWRQNSGMFLTLDGKRHVRATSIDGVADIGGRYFRIAVQIETKTLSGKQSEKQKNFKARWEHGGGVYIIARSPESAVSQLLGVEA